MSKNPKKMNFKLLFAVLILYYVASVSMGQGKASIVPRIEQKSNNSTCSVDSPIGFDGAPIPKEDLKNLDGKLKVELKDQSSSLTVPFLKLYLNC